MGLFENLNFGKLKSGLTKTRNRLVNSINETLTGVSLIDDSTIDEIEGVLISSDIGAQLTDRIIDNVREKFSIPKLVLPMMLLCIGYPESIPGFIPKLKRDIISHNEKYTRNNEVLSKS